MRPIKLYVGYMSTGMRTLSVRVTSSSAECIESSESAENAQVSEERIASRPNSSSIPMSAIEMGGMKRRLISEKEMYSMMWGFTTFIDEVNGESGLPVLEKSFFFEQEQFEIRCDYFHLSEVVVKMKRLWIFLVVRNLKKMKFEVFKMK